MLRLWRLCVQRTNLEDAMHPTAECQNMQVPVWFNSFSMDGRAHPCACACNIPVTPPLRRPEPSHTAHPPYASHSLSHLSGAGQLEYPGDVCSPFNLAFMCHFIQSFLHISLLRGSFQEELRALWAFISSIQFAFN